MLQYFEVKVSKILDKEVAKFGVGLAKDNYPYLRIVGSKDSVGIRGNGTIMNNDVEEKYAATDKIVGAVIGVGYQALSGKVFFTLNGKEVLSCKYECQDKIYPTFSMGSLEDKI